MFVISFMIIVLRPWFQPYRCGLEITLNKYLIYVKSSLNRQATLHNTSMIICITPNPQGVEWTNNL